MKLSGSIELKGPGLKRQELWVDTEDGNGMEILTTRTDKKEEAVDFSLSVEMQDKDEISISSEVADLKTFENNDCFYFGMRASERGNISIGLNYTQARAFKELLENQINAHDLVEKLLTPIVAKAA